MPTATPAPPKDTGGAGSGLGSTRSNGGDPAEPEVSSDIVIDGTGQLGFSVGGKQPTGSSLTLTGGKTKVNGSLSKGETIKVELTAVVHDVGFKDETDSKTGQVVGCERRHKARIVSVRVLSD